MAGIAFNLKKLIKSDSIQSTLSAYFYTALVTSGPWLFSVISLSLITLQGKVFTSEVIVSQFMGLAIYSFAGSMILTGGTQMAITRQISDCLYDHEESKIAGMFTGTLLLTLVLACLVGFPVLWILQLPFWTSLQVFVLFVLANIMWVTMVYISTLKAYMRIVWAFLIGFFSAVPAALVGGRYLGLDGFLIGLNLGLTFIVFILISSISIEFDGSFRPSKLVLQAHKKYWILYLTGAIGSLGIWADKMLFWYGEGISVLGPLRIYPAYDGAMFVAYLTVIPSMAYFVMIIETDFYEDLRRYFFLIENKAAYLVLEHARNDLIRELKFNSVRILIFQIILTSVILFISPWLMLVLHLDWSQWGIFRLACVGAFFHMAMSLISIVLAYFDCRMELFVVGALFLATNIAATWWTLGNYWNYGLGYVLAGFVTAGVGFLMACSHLQKLHYKTFANPPMVL
ncbi:MAG: exopolysaccharide Pel transporter PelG [SAR324 cluster bacterium]|nr:exopolysaccharide Pel transporter PelG [SAR324 cluster bacterium]